MNNKILSLFALLCLILISCDETTEGIGTSLTDNVDHLEVSANLFNVPSRSVAVDSVVSRNTTGYLGRIRDPETGAYITGDFMTQFNMLEGYTLEKKDSVASRDDSGEIIADSCEIRLFYTSYYGDSLATMKMTVHEMDHPMTEGVIYYSDFDPLENGYVREGGLHKSHTYSLVNTSELDEKNKDKSSTEDAYVNNICIRLNDPYTDRNGVTYNNFGTYILRTYYDHPEYFKNSAQFIKNVLPGFYFKMTGGLGSMAYVSVPQLNIYYRLYSNGVPTSHTTLLNGTEEILQTTKVTNDPEIINQLVNDGSCTYIKGPAGIFTELTLPVDEIMAGHDNDTINTAKLVLNRLNNTIQNDYVLPAPKTLLMIEKDSLKSFFENSKVANYKNSFLTSYSSTLNTYSFNNIGAMVTSMYAAKKSGLLSDPDWIIHHPNWNKVLVMPVKANYVTMGNMTILTSVTNDMSLTSARLVGGVNKLQVSVIYSKFK